MNLPLRLLLLLCLAAIVAGCTHRETPNESIDRVWNTWNFTKGEARLPVDQMIKQNQQIAREQGVAIIEPIMARSKDWQGEEGLIFVTLVAFLPRAQAVPILEHYKKDGKPWEQQAATDFLIELDMSDVKEMVQKYSAK